ncbi:MAG: WXG100 family type VII secretion target [Oscillospiraceae bacterium]|jgi:WXG100 family type VII secretion target|nr:WXG100 family type VII secretion target [Oscillospiraceae bacterium]
MAKIRITPETLESQAAKLNGMKEQHEGLYNQIKQLVNDVATEWEGEANQAFTQSFNSNDAAFKKFSQDMESFRQRMIKAAQEMRAAEESVKAKMSQL